jgi:hypothetical protein
MKTARFARFFGHWPWAILLALVGQSCMTTRVVTKDDCDTFANNPVNRKTTWTFAWGLVQPADIDPKCQQGTLNKVEVRTNLGYLLLSVVTVGIVVPQQVRWCCTPPSPPTKKIDG